MNRILRVVAALLVVGTLVVGGVGCSGKGGLGGLAQLAPLLNLLK